MPRLKPFTPLWQPAKAPAGCKLYLPLAEGAGTTVRDYAGGYNGSLVGSPSWQRGLYGPQLGGFSGSNYVAILNPPVVTLSYPYWIAVLSTNTYTASTTIPVGQGDTATVQAFAQLAYHWAVDKLAYSVRDNSGAQINAVSAVAPPLADGLPHLAMGVSFAANDHRLYFDGRQVAATTVTLPAPVTFGAYSIGGLVRGSGGSAGSPFRGSIQWAGLGSGSVPDPLSFAQDLLSGWFSAVRPRSNLTLWAALAGGSPAPFVGSPAAMMMGF